ncbi:MAG: Xaa-Pro aminopeptidase [Candidatus Berkiellales bacterium]
MITLSHFQARRQKVFEQMTDNSMAVLFAAPMQYRNSDTEQPYRQDSHFYYLTGFDESAAIAVLLKKGAQCRFILFCQDKDPTAEMWTGSRVGVNGAKEYGADLAYPIGETPKRFPELLLDIENLYYLVNAAPHLDQKLFSWLKNVPKKSRSSSNTPHKFIDLSAILNEMRLIKSTEEITLMRRAAEISVSAHIAAMQNCKPGMNEYNLEAILLHEFYRMGSRHVAYSSIVAAGNNACTLHYTRNQDLLKDKQLVLIDAGAEFENYAADITRTFPINGKFTSDQQAIYELVLASQTAAIDLVAPGVKWEEIQQKIIQVLVAGLIDLKILKGNLQDLIDQKAYEPFYMHNSGHWLGMDVHDVGDYKVKGQSRPLVPGMVFTIEPGLYFAENNAHVPEKWRGIGVRIEDDILTTSTGKEVLTNHAPKKVNAIEELMRKGNIS